MSFKSVLGCFDDDVGRHVLSCFEKLASDLEDLSAEMELNEGSPIILSIEFLKGCQA